MESIKKNIIIDKAVLDCCFLRKKIRAVQIAHQMFITTMNAMEKGSYLGEVNDSFQEEYRVLNEEYIAIKICMIKEFLRVGNTPYMSSLDESRMDDIYGEIEVLIKERSAISTEGGLKT